MEYHLNMPFLGAEISKLNCGDIVYLHGPLYTARDAAHKRIAHLVQLGLQLPFDLKGATIFYTGPCPAKPGEAIGPLGPTTSSRMDSFVEMMFNLGQRAMVGKGDRSPRVAALCKQYGGVYFLGIGGAAALTATTVTSANIVAFADLGTEAIRLLQVEGMKVFVGIDAKGNSLSEQEIPKYRRNHQ